MRPTRLITATVLGGVLVLTAPACNDEDGDSAVTDEELEDVDEELEDVGSQIDEEIEGQSTGDDEG